MTTKLLWMAIDYGVSQYQRKVSNYFTVTVRRCWCTIYLPCRFREDALSLCSASEGDRAAI